MAAAAIFFFEIVNFCLLLVSAGPRHITVPNFVKIGRSIAEILHFLRIFKMAAAAILDFWNREILLVIVVQSLEAHQHARFRQNRSIGCEDINIFLFFKMAAVAILDFRNRELLFADGIWRAQMHHCTKYCQNRSLPCGDIAFFFRIFKMATAAMLDFWNREILLVSGVQRVGDPSTYQILSKSVNRLQRY